MQINKIILNEDDPLDAAMEFIGLKDMSLVHSKGEVYLCYKEDINRLIVFKPSFSIIITRGN